jgi:hypothetical protein
LPFSKQSQRTTIILFFFYFFIIIEKEKELEVNDLPHRGMQKKPKRFKSLLSASPSRSRVREIQEKPDLCLHTRDDPLTIKLLAI